MYRRRSQTPFRTILSLILLGMLGGIAFLVYDGLRNTPASQSPTQNIIPTTQPTSESIVQSTPIPDQPLPTATSAPHTVSLVIPSLAINAPIIDVYLVDGIWDVSVLGANVGHLQGTARVGEEGNTVLSGHVELRDGTKGVF
ncbi:MAG TPA: hypothetical protein PLZ51_06420, partial [Aggregatilineales bacterium]|nr:hypothetical protein [Aggregatilineales bacterium]